MDGYTAAGITIQGCSVESQLRVEGNVSSVDQNRRGRGFLGAPSSICASLHSCDYRTGSSILFRVSFWYFNNAPMGFQITHDFVLNVAKSVTDSRKKVLEGVGKGMAKLNAAHGQS